MTNVSRDADHLLGRRHIEVAHPLLICIAPPSSAPENPVIASPGVQEALSGVNRPSCDLCAQGACEAGTKFWIGQIRILLIAIVTDLVHQAWRPGPALGITLSLFSGKESALSRSRSRFVQWGMIASVGCLLVQNHCRTSVIATISASEETCLLPIFS
jgi:hypothetical protein